MTPSLDSLDPRAKRWAYAAIGIASLIFGFWVAPFILTALGGLAGLVASGLFLTGVWMLLPWVAAKAANVRMKLVKHEAATNPVETLQNEHLRQTKELNSRKAGIEILSGLVRIVAETISKLEKEFPDSPELPQLRVDYNDLLDYESLMNEEWKACYVTLGEFDREIQRASRIWDVAVAIAKARGASGLSQEEWSAKLKTETSFDAIRLKLNTGLAGLNTDKMKADADRILKGKIQAQQAQPVTTSRKMRITPEVTQQ
jgi:hypothetical protein